MEAKQRELRLRKLQSDEEEWHEDVGQAAREIDVDETVIEAILRMARPWQQRAREAVGEVTSRRDEGPLPPDAPEALLAAIEAVVGEAARGRPKAIEVQGVGVLLCLAWG